jgi:hypothetical protein
MLGWMSGFLLAAMKEQMMVVSLAASRETKKVVK